MQQSSNRPEKKTAIDNIGHYMALKTALAMSVCDANSNVSDAMQNLNVWPTVL